ncbi:hypothetical protein PTW32_00815 [Dechloromonas agitata]|uniref:hypothetical protein n=1 Tax=Dechloromonas agitata TaxID=73030 RepID=UPI00237EAA89|nr:hypothetical protein [Dechloromonas agitata]MDE1543941.1 hypothetical protein [Dechloromonas agitata]
MNPSFREVITAADGDRLDLFLGAATRMGTAVQNVEKDFWVCWTLDTLFNGLAKGGPRMGGRCGGDGRWADHRSSNRWCPDGHWTRFRIVNASLGREKCWWF